ncbi:neuronal membrane glycoprotein M6-a-like [Crassostrea angulata]|uniref:neuronal membrane glycoprotein M6-a-like n=1 Tax=Magallana angulata TaxID=2784310 RepID=UPI0005C3D1C9|nr:neuronal membrane glycoprotein M6-a-like [Crassostrea angulata]|eukprot:XP_011442533.1 PREDICTED: neuronal membrane glycoprotein M6-a [Crassostrea gigas]
MGALDKLGNCPFASLMATIIVFVGVGVFCGTLYRALQIIIINVMEGLFQFSVSWLSVVQIVFIVIGVVMALFSIVLLVFGFLATGATRQNVYSGKRCIMGGRVSAGFFMAMSFLLNLVWLVILGVATIPVFLYVMLGSICNTEVYGNNFKTVKYCFKLSHYGIYRNSTYPLLGVAPPGKDELCNPTELRLLCDNFAEAGPLFCTALAGAACIIIGMIFYMTILSSNYTRIKISKELTDYRNAVDMEEIDLHSNGRGILDQSYDKSSFR